MEMGLAVTDEGSSPDQTRRCRYDHKSRYSAGPGSPQHGSKKGKN